MKGKVYKMNKRNIYAIIVMSLVISFGSVYMNTKSTTTLNLSTQEVDYKTYVQEWLSAHQKLTEECPIAPIGNNIDTIQEEYVKLKEVRKVLESYIYDEDLVPEKYKEIHSKLQDSIVACLYGVDQLMDGLLHSDNRLIELGKASVLKSYGIIDEVREELPKIN